jgi:hypothetical protein
MAVALALGLLQDRVGGEAIDDEPAVEVGTKNRFGDFVAATLADGVDGNVVVGEDPQPGIEATDASAGLIGMDDVGTAQGVDEQGIGGPGQLGQALLGADQGRRANGEIAISVEEVTDLALGDTPAGFEFGGPGEGDGAEGVAGSADGIGDLLGMASLTTEPADRTVTGLAVELGDARDDGRQVGLVLDDDAGIDERAVALRTGSTRDLDDPIDAFGGRRGAVGRGMAGTATGLLLAFLGLTTAKRRGLAVGLALGFAKLLTQATVVFFQLRQAALQAGHVAVGLDTTRTGREHHDNPQARFVLRGWHRGAWS